MTLIFLLIFLLILSFILTTKKKVNNRELFNKYEPTQFNLNENQLVFLNLLIEYRKDNKLSTDIFVDLLMSEKATEFIESKTHLSKEEFSHKGNHIIFDKLKEFGFFGSSDILSRSHNSVSSLFNNYVRSKSHNNILLSNYKYIGIGIVNYNNRYYSCILFSNRKNKN
jgi:uncharacterized protein YkwD